MAAEEILMCPECGTEMNHHADKLIYEGNLRPDLGGVIQELYRCPACGAGASRPEDTT